LISTPDNEFRFHSGVAVLTRPTARLRWGLYKNWPRSARGVFVGGGRGVWVFFQKHRATQTPQVYILLKKK
ncbi:hypothetical protein, partial [Enterobacter asburiae]